MLWIKTQACSSFSTGINKQIAVDAAYFPIVSTADPRAVGLPQDPHGNTMLSSLSSGFLCPLSDPASPSEVSLPEPGRRPRDCKQTQLHV